MKTNMHPNSLDTYTDLDESGWLSKGQKKVVKILRRFGNLSREQIANKTFMKESSVCGRVHELIVANVIIEVGTTKTIAGNSAAILALSPKFQPETKS